MIKISTVTYRMTRAVALTTVLGGALALTACGGDRNTSGNSPAAPKAVKATITMSGKTLSEYTPTQVKSLSVGTSAKHLIKSHASDLNTVVIKKPAGGTATVTLSAVSGGKPAYVFMQRDADGKDTGTSLASTETVTLNTQDRSKTYSLYSDPTQHKSALADAENQKVQVSATQTGFKDNSEEHDYTQTPPTNPQITLYPGDDTIINVPVTAAGKYSIVSAQAQNINILNKTCTAASNGGATTCPVRVQVPTDEPTGQAAAVTYGFINLTAVDAKSASVVPPKTTFIVDPNIADLATAAQRKTIAEGQCISTLCRHYVHLENVLSQIKSTNNPKVFLNPGFITTLFRDQALKSNLDSQNLRSASVLALRDAAAYFSAIRNDTAAQNLSAAEKIMEPSAKNADIGNGLKAYVQSINTLISIAAPKVNYGWDISAPASTTADQFVATDPDANTDATDFASDTAATNLGSQLSEVATDIGVFPVTTPNQFLLVSKHDESPIQAYLYRKSGVPQYSDSQIFQYSDGQFTGWKASYEHNKHWLFTPTDWKYFTENFVGALKAAAKSQQLAPVYWQIPANTLPHKNELQPAEIYATLAQYKSDDDESPSQTGFSLAEQKPVWNFGNAIDYFYPKSKEIPTGNKDLEHDLLSTAYTGYIGSGSTPAPTIYWGGNNSSSIIDFSSWQMGDVTVDTEGLKGIPDKSQVSCFGSLLTPNSEIDSATARTAGDKKIVMPSYQEACTMQLKAATGTAAAPTNGDFYDAQNLWNDLRHKNQATSAFSSTDQNGFKSGIQIAEQSAPKIQSIFSYASDDKIGEPGVLDDASATSLPTKSLINILSKTQDETKAPIYSKVSPTVVVSTVESLNLDETDPTISNLAIDNDLGVVSKVPQDGPVPAMYLHVSYNSIPQGAKPVLYAGNANAVLFGNNDLRNNAQPKGTGCAPVSKTEVTGCYFPYPLQENTRGAPNPVVLRWDPVTVEMFKAQQAAFKGAQVQDTFRKLKDPTSSEAFLNTRPVPLVAGIDGNATYTNAYPVLKDSSVQGQAGTQQYYLVVDNGPSGSKDKIPTASDTAVVTCTTGKALKGSTGYGYTCTVTGTAINISYTAPSHR